MSAVPLGRLHFWLCVLFGVIYKILGSTYGHTSALENIPAPIWIQSIQRFPVATLLIYASGIVHLVVINMTAAIIDVASHQAERNGKRSCLYNIVTRALRGVRLNLINYRDLAREEICWREIRRETCSIGELCWLKEKEIITLTCHRCLWLCSWYRPSCLYNIVTRR